MLAATRKRRQELLGRDRRNVTAGKTARVPRNPRDDGTRGGARL
jgi:hypothetical protein